MIGFAETVKSLNVQHRTSNIEHRMEKMKKQAYDLEESLLEYSVRIIKNDILQETEELIRIFAASIKTAQRNRK